MSSTRISKSQYIRGRQCPRSLWYYRHRPDLAPRISDSQQALFDAGHEVGRLAQQYFDGGLEITEEFFAVDQAMAATRKAVGDGRRVIFEATAAAPDGAFSRIDILKKVRGSAAWDLIEVKMATKVRDYHLDDLALQRHAFTGAGYEIRKSILMHINNQYVRRGDLDPRALFTLADRTRQVNARLPETAAGVAALQAVIKQTDEPAIAPGDHCFCPFECDYTGHCLPPQPDHSVHLVFRSGRKLDTLLTANITTIDDISDDILPGLALTERQKIAVMARKNRQVHINTRKIKKFLAALEYPLYFLDYETINSPVPLFDDSRPYQQIPFQFSLHIQQKKGAAPAHLEFLHTAECDPRPDLINRLISTCGDHGSVIVYNQSFEKRVNYELGRDFPAFRPALQRISARMVDIMAPFRARHLYHPDMRGSASLKKVLPSFFPAMSYDHLAIGDGNTAAQLYLNCLKGTIPGDEQKQIFDNLRLYCGQDTLAEVKLLEVMYGLV